jgi:6 kDa early secretory antigenic target
MPADGHILVTFGAIADAQADTNMVAQQLNSELADLKAYLAPLVATWTGQAASNYQALQAKWDAAQTDLNAVLAQISAALGTANGNYTQAESANASMWA